MIHFIASLLLLHRIEVQIQWSKNGRFTLRIG